MSSHLTLSSAGTMNEWMGKNRKKICAHTLFPTSEDLYDLRVCVEIGRRYGAH